jgi:hypothetical protein
MEELIMNKYLVRWGVCTAIGVVGGIATGKFIAKEIGFSLPKPRLTKKQRKAAADISQEELENFLNSDNI